MPFITVHHPDQPNSTHKMDQFAFDNVWKAKGWKEGEYTKPSKSKKKTDSDTSESDTADADT